MFNNWKIILLAVGILVVQESNAQKEDKLRHRLTFLFSHTHFYGLEENTSEKKMVIAASIGFNYEYALGKHWAVGLHNDLFMVSFKQEDKESGESLSRENPYLVSVVAIYKPWEKWSFYAGPGKEFERNKDFKVIKTGAEFGLPLARSFDIGFGGEYDWRIGGRDSWALGFSVGWKF